MTFAFTIVRDFANPYRVRAIVAVVTQGVALG